MFNSLQLWSNERGVDRTKAAQALQQQLGIFN